MKTKVYRFRSDWMAIFVVFGVLCTSVAIYVPFMGDYPNTFLHATWRDTFLLIFIELLMFPMGILFLMIAIVSKIVITVVGIEHHLLTAIVKVRWEDMTFQLSQEITGDKLSMHAVNPEIVVRPWVHWLPVGTARLSKGILYNAKHQGIPLSQYGGSTPGQLIEEIKKHISS